MGRKEKLLRRAKESPNNFRFTDLIKLAEHHGFAISRQKGSHVMMIHEEESLFMNFQERNGEAKPYQVKQLTQVIEENNLQDT
ncbi:MAG: type II toxin-antitoxin system HicA family toxin [Balneolaceae bacterium]